MERTEVFNEVKEMVAKYCKNEEALKNISDSTHFIEDLEINSARLVDIIIDFEDKYDIEIEDEEVENLMTMGDGVDLIMKKMAVAAA